MSRASEQNLADLHGELAKELTTRIKEGEKKIELVDCEGTVKEHEIMLPVGANVLSVARQFLKDNHIEAAGESKPLDNLVNSLPFDEEENTADGTFN